MTNLSILTIIDYLNKNGYPDPDNDLIMSYVDAKKYQKQNDEAVKNNYPPADLDRWIILMDLLGFEITYDTAMTISGALDSDELNPTDVFDLQCGKIEELLYIKAIRDYDELNYMVQNFEGDSYELCKKLQGYNYDSMNGIFDCNYKTITATIRYIYDRYMVCKYLDIWDDKHSKLVKEQIDIKELRKLVNKND